MLINEVLANEPGSSTDGEFVELVNAGTTVADVSGWKVADSAATRHTFPAGTVIQPGKALLVTGATASTGSLGLSNSGDSVTLSSASGTRIDGVTYGSSLASVDGVSMNRSTDGSASAAFVLHTTLSSLSASPGTKVNGSAF